MIIGYSRIEEDGDLDAILQAEAFRGAKVDQVIFEGKITGRWGRPRFAEMVERLNKGDLVVVWKLERLCQSLHDVLFILWRIEQAGAGFKSLTEAVDTTTPSGRMFMQVVQALMRFNRMPVNSKIQSEIKVALKKPKPGVRPPDGRLKLRPSQRKKIAKNILSGKCTGAEMVHKYKVSAATVSRIVKQYRDKLT